MLLSTKQDVIREIQYSFELKAETLGILVYEILEGSSVDKKINTSQIGVNPYTKNYLYPYQSNGY